MAKKKETLTPEERLQAALVPESEQPYPVPGNWCWTKVGVLSDLYRGVSYKKQEAHAERQEQDCLILRGGNVLEGAIDTETSDNVYVNRNLVREDQLLQPYDVIIVSSTGSSKVIGRAGVSYTGYDNVAFGAFLTLVRPNDGVVKPFIAYYFQSDVYRNRIRELAAGVNINNIKANYITESPIPLPPFSEQERIVDRIESLFAKLDEAKQKAQDALDSFETRKAAILHKAFTGELTAQWRKEHGVGMESWKTKKLSEVSTLQTGLMKGKNYSGKTTTLPYLRVANVQDGFLNLSEIKEIEVLEELIDRYSLRNGDVLFTEGGDYDKLGRGTVWQGQIKNCLHQNHVFVVRPYADILNPYFLSYQAGSRYGKQYFLKCSKQTTNLASINSTQLKGFPVLMPTIEEQVQIVLLVDDLLSKEQQAKDAAEGVLEQIDLIKKAILARAFRGELGTNDSSEGSAAELLCMYI